MAGAASDDSDDEFSKALECSIHIGVLNQPKALPCQHTFCRDCLGPLVENNHIKCPLCREMCQLPTKGVNSLPNNITVQNILDTLCMSCQKRHKKTNCLCCQQQVCRKCKIQHLPSIQTEIRDKKQELRNMAKVLSEISQSLGQNETRFMFQVAKTKSEIKAIIAKAIEQLRRRQAQLEAELDSLIWTEIMRIDQCQENMKIHEQEIQAALQRSDGDDTAIVKNLERLSQNITALICTMAVGPATVSCKLDEQLVQDVSRGLGQIDYKPPQPGPGAPTDLQSVSIDYQAIGQPRKVIGQKGRGPGQFRYPTHIAVSPVSGNLVVCNMGDNKVQVFTIDGKFIRKFGSKGKGEGQFEFGYYVDSGGVTVTYRGDIVIVDSNNHRLQVFDEAGGFVRVIGSHGSFPGKFDGPTGVTCDHSDQLYVCDSGNERVQVMTMAGSVVRVIAGSDVPGGVWEPVDIAVCRDGDLVVVDRLIGSRGLHVLSATGQYKATIPCGRSQHVKCESPVGVAVNPQGHILVTDGHPDDTQGVYVLKKSGELVCSFGGRGTSLWEFNCPVGVAVTQNGHIIVVDHRHHCVKIF